LGQRVSPAASLHKQTAAHHIASQQNLGNHAATQHEVIPMVARLDALALALALFASTMAIEDSHRLDAGAPDDGLVAAASTSEISASDTGGTVISARIASTCAQDQARASAERDRRTAFEQTVNIETGLMIINNAADEPAACE
jgi:hypothetical protein